jgi:hypothetical protein
LSSIYLLKIALNAMLLSPLNSTFCSPLFRRNKELMLPFKVTVASSDYTCFPTCKVKYYGYACFLSSPFSIVIVFVVPQFLHFTPKSDISQKAWGVRYLYSPHFLHYMKAMEDIFRLYFIKDDDADCTYTHRRIRLLHEKSEKK